MQSFVAAQFDNLSEDRFGSIAPNAARVLQRRMSVAARKRQLATKMRHVVKGQHGRRYRTLGKDSDRYLW